MKHLKIFAVPATLALFSACVSGSTAKTGPLKCKAEHIAITRRAMENRSKHHYRTAMDLEVQAAQVAHGCWVFQKNPPGIDMIVEGANLLGAAEDARRAGLKEQSIDLVQKAQKNLRTLVGVPKSALGQRLVLDFLKKANADLAAWSK